MGQNPHRLAAEDERSAPAMRSHRDQVAATFFSGADYSPERLIVLNVNKIVRYSGGLGFSVALAQDALRPLPYSLTIALESFFDLLSVQ